MTGTYQLSSTVTRIVDWVDTDAAGIYHHSTVLRWVEAAEAEFFTTRGLLDVIPTLPRVRYEVDYVNPVRFGDQVIISLHVTKLGNSSINYLFDVHKGETPIARGKMVAVRINPATGKGEPWSDPERTALGADLSTTPG